MTPETQLKSFIGKFEAKDQRLIRAVRRAVRRRFAGAWELVYNNYNFFVIGYSPTERPSDAIVSLPPAPGTSGSASFVGPRCLIPGNCFWDRVIRHDTSDSIRQLSWLIPRLKR